MRLLNKNIIITGASGLLGKEHARAVLSQGGSVGLIDINFSELQEFKSEFGKDEKSKVEIFDCDITDEYQVASIPGLVERKFGPITGLINNAAINASVESGMKNFMRLENFSIEIWNKEIQVGLTGALICSKVFGSRMVENKIAGSIVHISSDHGLIAPNQNLYKQNGIDNNHQPVKPVSYSVIKHGLIGLSKYLSTYWCSHGIRSNTICPGGILNGQDAEFLSRVSELIPLKRLANPDEYRGALIFLLSDESSYMTGATLVVDGGRSVW